MDQRRMIIGYDPGHAGDDAVRLGRLLAEVLNSKPIVLTAMPWPAFPMDSEELQRRVDESTEEHFATVREQLSGLDVETRGAATPSIAGALDLLAEQEDATIIILGSSHRGPVGRTLLGSVGESLIHGATCAVAVAPRGYAERENPRLHRIAVAFDGTAEASVALETAIGIAERCHGELTVITIADFPNYGYAAAWGILATGEFHDFEREDKERLVELALGRGPTGIPCHARLLTGRAGPLLTEASTEFDLLVTGSRAYGPLHRTLLGSTTRKLIRSSACPVLVLPRGVDGDPLGIRPDEAGNVRNHYGSDPGSGTDGIRSGSL